MAGHSKFANIKHRKGAQDKKRGNLFTKLAREIIVAAKSGMPDPEHNPALRTAIANARSQSMPKDKIEHAISKASNTGEGEDYFEITYEGFAPNGIGLIIEVLTDNKNRSASEVRSILGKNGGNLGESGSVSFMFDHVGYVRYPAEKADDETMLESVIEAGGSDSETTEEFHEIYSEKEDFNVVKDSLEKQYGEAEEARLIWKAKDLIGISEEVAEKIISLIDKLEDSDDVKNVYSNYQVEQ